MAISKPQSAKRPARKSRGFLQTGSLLRTPIRKAAEKRGFAETRVLTLWEEIVGAQVAKLTRPIKISYAQKGIGARLTLLCAGANAPMVQMQIPQILKRVNACYGYNAIGKIILTQTAPTGFSDPQSEFAPKAPRPKQARDMSALASDVEDVESEALRNALQKLASNIAGRAPMRGSGKD